jgi:two-component system response regulator FixJ
VSKTIEKDTQVRAKYDEVHEVQGRLALLTPRGHEIFRYVITGLLNKQIAYALGISEKAVKVHRGRIMGKLRVDSVAELGRLEMTFSSTS